MNLSNAEASVASLRAKLASYEAQYAQLKNAARLVPQVEAEYTQLNRDYEIQKKMYETLLARKESATMGEDVQGFGGTQFRVLDPPRVSPQPVPPTRSGSAAPAFAVSLAPGWSRLSGEPDHADVPRCAYVARSHQASDPRDDDDAAERSSEQVEASQRPPVCGWPERFAGSFVAIFAARRFSDRACYEGRSMSLIEQAAKRLEELRRAGAATGEDPAHAEARPSARDRPAGACSRRRRRPSKWLHGGESAPHPGARFGPPRIVAAAQVRRFAGRAKARRRDSRSISSA